MEEREAADVVNDFGRDPIGEGKEERVGSLHLAQRALIEMLVTEIQQGTQVNPGR